MRQTASSSSGHLELVATTASSGSLATARTRRRVSPIALLPLPLERRRRGRLAKAKKIERKSDLLTAWRCGTVDDARTTSFLLILTRAANEPVARS
ncbi:hypothetical protein MRX96_035546 [Rhipicephalus microplus]